MLDGELKYNKIGLKTGVTLWGHAAKSGKKTHLLVVTCMRLSQNIGLLDLKNRTLFKRGNGYKIRTKSVRDYWVMRLMIHTRTIYYWHTNVNLLGLRVKTQPKEQHVISEIPRFKNSMHYLHDGMLHYYM